MPGRTVGGNPESAPENRSEWSAEQLKASLQQSVVALANTVNVMMQNPAGLDKAEVDELIVQLQEKARLIDSSYMVYTGLWKVGLTVTPMTDLNLNFYELFVDLEQKNLPNNPRQKYIVLAPPIVELLPKTTGMFKIVAKGVVEPSSSSR